MHVTSYKNGVVKSHPKAVTVLNEHCFLVSIYPLVILELNIGFPLGTSSRFGVLPYMPKVGDLQQSPLGCDDVRMKSSY